ncbi:MAG: hypothetical protein NTX49_07015 [Chlamydiae bacterium]|nr:hypothetical protein [Chlamydiota bacterium]
MASISTSFQELNFPSISDANPQCGICWEQGGPERPLFNIHPSTLPEIAERHLACRTCTIRCLTNADLTIKQVFMCHICRKVVSVDLAAARALELPDHQIPLGIFYFTSPSQSMTPAIRAVEATYRRMREDPTFLIATPPPNLQAVTNRLLYDPFLFR